MVAVAEAVCRLPESEAGDAGSPLWQKLCCLAHVCLGADCPEAAGCLLNRLRRDAAASQLEVAQAQAALLGARTETVAMRRQAEQSRTALALLARPSLATLVHGVPALARAMTHC